MSAERGRRDARAERAPARGDRRRDQPRRGRLHRGEHPARGRNVEWAARPVRESVSSTADEAARTNVVDFVAKDLDELVRLADGRTVDVAGERRPLALSGVRGADGQVRVVTYEMSLAQRLL